MGKFVELHAVAVLAAAKPGQTDICSTIEMTVNFDRVYYFHPLTNHQHAANCSILLAGANKPLNVLETYDEVKGLAS